MKRILTYEIPAEFAGRRVKDYLFRELKMSTALVVSLKKSDDAITVNGEPVRVSRILSAGDVLTLTMHDGVSENIEPEDIPIDVLYEDEDILAVNKPSGMPVHISPGHYGGTLSNAVMYYYGGDFTFRAVNRLDAVTSGVMLIAKNAYAHARLSDDIHRGLYHRRYIALVHGDVTVGTIDAPIARKAASVIERTVSPDGKHAVTHYRALDRFGRYSLCEVMPVTGRTHQIRVHMAYIGHPLAGDTLYGVPDDMPRCALHSHIAEFRHPVTGERMSICAPMAADIAAFAKTVK